MESVDDPKEIEGYSRTERILGEAEGKLRLRIMHWNVLADCLAFGFPKVPEKWLDKEYRIPRIVKEIEDNGEDVDGERRAPSFICWQEMDMEEDIIEKVNLMKRSGFKDFCYAFEKIEKKGGHNDALCIFNDENEYK